MTFLDVAQPISGERSIAEHTGGQHCNDCPTPEQIARLAFEIYERRGRRDGHDVDDWLSAERALTHHYR